MEISQLIIYAGIFCKNQVIQEFVMGITSAHRINPTLQSIRGSSLNGVWCQVRWRNEGEDKFIKRFLVKFTDWDSACYLWFCCLLEANQAYSIFRNQDFLINSDIWDNVCRKRNWKSKFEISKRIKRQYSKIQICNETPSQHKLQLTINFLFFKPFFQTYFYFQKYS